MNWYEWLGYHSMDINADTELDTLGSMQKAYVAGLQTAYDQMYMNEDGDYDFVMWRLKSLIEESK
jgi:hypothetical protein